MLHRGDLLSDIYKFKIVPDYEKYYSDMTSYGVYAFVTNDKIPHTEPYKTIEMEFGMSDDTHLSYMGNIAGRMQQLIIGEEYDVEASLEFNKKYNTWQYVPIRITTDTPTTVVQQKKFLQSLVTDRQAEILLSVYPNIVQDIIDGKNIDLSKTKGIKEITFDKIKEKVITNYVISDIIVMLQPLGVSFNMIKKLVDNEPNPVLLKKKLLDNPYILTKIHGLGFKRVDGLALKLVPDIRLTSKRVYAFIDYYLNETGESEGHTWVLLQQLMSAVRDNIPECVDIFKDTIEQEKQSPVLLHIDGNKIGLEKYYDIEKCIFEILNELQSLPSSIDIKNIDTAIKQTENQLGFTLTEEQKQAIISIKENNVVIVTGSAGTGKTTIIQGIINASHQYSLALCSLSAKAAQRIKEVTGQPARTIHRLLEWGQNGFARNADNPLYEDIIIVDEASMINSGLFLSLVRAIKPGNKLVIVFDYAQLPPIGAGNIASDLLHSQFKINKFTKIHRQAEKSGILVDANKIRVGINPISKPEKIITHGELQDMFYMFASSKEAINQLVIESYMKAIKTLSLDDVVIIVPRKKDCINSTQEINIKIQDLLIKDNVPFITRGKIKFKLGAKVIQKVNDYDKNVFNGEMGYLININDTDKERITFKIKFDEEKTVDYTKDEINNIELAYAITVHSAQGSQWHTVIMAVDSSHYILLDSCLLYTGVTRAIKRCLLIAEPKAFIRCISNNKGKVRQTYLKEFYNK